MSSKSKGSNQNIQAFVRVRPTNASELKSRSVVEVKSNRDISVKDSKQSNAYKTFSFNNVFGPSSTQMDVYRAVVQPLIDEVLSGYNCTVFAYGQTGTGKTFTMEGERSPDTSIAWEKDPLAGIVPRTLSQLFDELRLLEVNFCVKVSFLELYNEELFDLLSPADDTTKLRIFEDSHKKGAVIIQGLEEVAVHSKADVYEILERGSHKRQTAATLMNAHSSRSHTVFTVTVHIRESANDGEEFMKTGKINLVDLAGSENIGRSGAVEKRAREAGNINQSLLTLGRVITALVDHSPHVPYRESKLTRILQESLGGCTKTSIIATVSPAACNLEETLSTLDYAHRAKNIQNRPEINQKICKKTLLKEYSGEIERLQRDLEATRQRTGVYLAQSEYDDMFLRLDELEADLKSKEQEMGALCEEREKKKAICDELSSEVKVLEAAMKEKANIRAKQKERIIQLKMETKEVVRDTAETDYLTMCHMETLQHLSAQTDSLHKATVDSTKAVDLLHDKIKRSREASQHNESSVQEFVRNNTELIDETKALIDEKVNFLPQAVSDITSFMNESFKTIEDYGYSALAAAGEMTSLQAKAVSLSTQFNRLIVQDSELQTLLEDKLHVHLCNRSEVGDGILAAISKYEDRSHLDLLEKMEKDAVLEMSLAIGNGVECLHDWSKECSSQYETILKPFSEKAEFALSVLDNTQRDHGTFYQAYLQNQEMIEEKLKSIMNIVSEVDALRQNGLELVDSCSDSALQNVENLGRNMEDAQTIVQTGLEKQRTQIETVQGQLQQKLDIIPKKFEMIVTPIPSKPAFPSLDIVSQCVQTFKDASSKYDNEFMECFKQDTDAFEEISSFVNETTKNIVDSLTKCKQEVAEHVTHHISAVEDLRTGVLKRTEVLDSAGKSLEESLVEKMNDFENGIENVQLRGAKPDTPTGKTPLRSEMRIPSDLPSTSPHERIVSRLRSKYRIPSKTCPADLDISLTDTDMDISLSENDVIANKENSIKDSAEKSFQGETPIKRKALLGTNY